jgi:hypothetical protein
MASLGRHRHPPAAGDEELAESYYAPMADLLAGILFIILVLLMSFAIIHYPDANSVPVSPLARAQQQLAEPEVDSRAKRLMAMEEERRKLLAAVVADLTADGIAARADMATSQVLIDDESLFKPGLLRLTFTGERNMLATGRIIRRRVQCHYGNADGCSPPPVASLLGIFVDVFVDSRDLAAAGTGADPAIVADARALSILGTMVEGEPSLLELRTPANSPMIQARGRVAQAGNAPCRIAIGFAMGADAR